MHRIDAAGHSSNTFTDGTPGLVEATVVDDDWLNAVQEELVHVILTQAGIPLVKGTNTQLWAAMAALLGRLGAANTWTAANTFNVDGAGWTALTLNSGGNWTTAFGDETTFYQPKYRKDSFGRVWLRGRAARTSGNNGTIGTLPTGYRPSPSGGQFFPVVTQGGSAVGAVQVAGDGSIGWAIGDPGGTSDLQLDGVCFYV